MNRSVAKRRGGAVWLTALIALLCLVLAGLWWVVTVKAGQQQDRHFRELMAVTDLGNAPAPNFTLTDQNGQTFSLSSFRGKNVVLEFMDPACTDICPIVSQEMIHAAKDLGAADKNTVFLAVNVNQYHEKLSDVMGFSKEQGLNQLSNWHFLTGPTSSLKRVWKAYGISVMPNPTGDVQHSSFMFFINAKGQEQFIANPDNAKSTILEWGDGISHFVKQLS